MATQIASSIPTKRLSAPIQSTDMSITLNSYTSWNGTALTAADFSTTGRGVFRSTDGKTVEFFTFDPTTIAGPVTILARGLDYKGGTTDGVGTKYPWSAYSTLVELGSNPPAMEEDYVDKISNETIAGVKTFSSSPVVPTGGTGTQAANATDIANAVIGASGTATASVFGTVKTSVAPASIGNPVVVGQNDPQFVNYFAETGAANAYVITPSPSIGAYAIGQRFSFKATNANTTTSTLNINALGAKTILRADGVTVLVANDILAGQIVSVEYDGTNFIMLSGTGNLPAPSSSIKAGGTGADGALTIASGTTTIDCANAAIVIKNYTSISITGTGALVFINPNTNGTLVIIKYTGACTLTSSATPMIDMSGMGAVGGAVKTASTNADGNDGNDGYGYNYKTNHGTKATAVPAIGTGGAVASGFVFQTTATFIKYFNLFIGAGGGSGNTQSSANSVTSGVGGNGGGCLIMEGGPNSSWNFTTANGISVAGKNGGNGVGVGANTAGGGGGGGAAGFFLSLYNTLIANSGTVTVTGGTGGNNATTNAVSGYGGGGGASLVNAGNNGTGSSSNGAKTGGDGAAGFSLVQKNTEYA